MSVTDARVDYRVALEAARADDDVPSGYKRTEVGVIPEDWDVVATGSLGKFRGGNGFPLAYQGKTVGDYPFFKVSDMNNKGNEIEMLIANNYISDAVRKRLGAHAFPATTIIFAKVGAAVFLERKKLLAVPSCIDNNMAGFTITDEGCAFQYVLYYFLSFSLGSLVSMTALPSLSGGALNRIQIPIPPTLVEQHAIADVLSDTDALIESLQQLIAKQRTIKQGAMQALLTGRQRFPGFTGKWRVALLGDVADCLDGVRVPLNDSQRSRMRGEYPYCGANGILDYVNAYVIDDDIILMAEDGGYFDEYETRPIAYRMYGKCWVNNHAHILKAKPPYNQGFLFYSLVHKDITSFLANGTRAKLNKFEMNKIEVRLPENSVEQTAIATALSDMDAEIEALEARLAKTRALKAGMMQQLLTGRIRLPLERAA